jgi:hypothetical protein
VCPEVDGAAAERGRGHDSHSWGGLRGSYSTTAADLVTAYASGTVGLYHPLWASGMHRWVRYHY